jgi:spore germination protein GerM
LVAVERSIPFTSTPIQDAHKLLLKGGLTQAERESGLSTEYPLLGVKLNGAALNNDVLTLNLSDPNNRTQGGSCRVGILRSQIEATARQFSGISRVEFINGELFQP